MEDGYRKHGPQFDKTRLANYNREGRAMVEIYLRSNSRWRRAPKF